MGFQNQNQGFQNGYGGKPLVNYFLDKRIVITGASSGIGQAVSFWYLNQGACVILVGKDEMALKK